MVEADREARHEPAPTGPSGEPAPAEGAAAGEESEAVPSAQIRPTEAEPAVKPGEEEGTENPADASPAADQPDAGGGVDADPVAEPESDAESTPEPRLPGGGTAEGDRLREAHAAFEAGDYPRVRQLCDQLTHAPEDVAHAAADLRRRTEIDLVQVAILAGCLAFFLVIVYLYAL